MPEAQGRARLVPVHSLNLPPSQEGVDDLGAVAEQQAPTTDRQAVDAAGGKVHREVRRGGQLFGERVAGVQEARRFHVVLPGEDKRPGEPVREPSLGVHLQRVVHVIALLGVVRDAREKRIRSKQRRPRNGRVQARSGRHQTLKRIGDLGT